MNCCACSPSVPKRDKDYMYYLQKHGENLEADPPTYGCLHPRWKKQHKSKLLSKEELTALWQLEQCSMAPINPKSSHHMTSLDKWTVSALHCSCCDSLFGLAELKCMLLVGMVWPASPRRLV